MSWFTAGFGRPEIKPPNGTLISYYFVEPQGVYLWEIPEGSDKPIYIQLKWNAQMASQLSDVERIAELKKNEGKDGTIMIKKYGNHINGDNVFYFSEVKPPKPKRGEI